MGSNEGARARQRAERERAQAEAASQRRAAARRRSARQDRWQVVRRPFARLLGTQRRAPSGSLAARRQQSTRMVVAGVLAVNLLVLFAADSWATPAFVVLLSILLTPIALGLMNRK